MCRWMLGNRVRIGPAGADGRVEMELRGHRIESLAGEIAGLGAAIEVVDPPELRRYLARVGVELGATYADEMTAAGPSRENEATANLPGVTAVSRAPALVLDVENGYFDRLLLTAVRRLAILLGQPTCRRYGGLHPDGTYRPPAGRAGRSRSPLSVCFAVVVLVPPRPPEIAEQGDSAPWWMNSSSMCRTKSALSASAKGPATGPSFSSRAGSLDQYPAPSSTRRTPPPGWSGRPRPRPGAGAVTSKRPGAPSVGSPSHTRLPLLAVTADQMAQAPGHVGERRRIGGRRSSPDGTRRPDPGLIDQQPGTGSQRYSSSVRPSSRAQVRPQVYSDSCTRLAFTRRSVMPCAPGPSEIQWAYGCGPQGRALSWRAAGGL